MGELVDSGIFGWVVLNLILSFVVAKIASDRGRSFAGFFWLSFLLSSIIGLLVALLSPPVSSAAVEYRDPRLVVKCPLCAEPVLAEAKVCKHCHRDIEPQLELIAEVNEADRIQAIEKRKRALSGIRSSTIAVSIVMFISSAVLLFLGISVMTLAMAESGKMAGFVFSVLGLALLIWGVLKLRRMPKKDQLGEM